MQSFRVKRWHDTGIQCSNRRMSLKKSVKLLRRLRRRDRRGNFYTLCWRYISLKCKRAIYWFALSFIFICYYNASVIHRLGYRFLTLRFVAHIFDIFLVFSNFEVKKFREIWSFCKLSNVRVYYIGIYNWIYYNDVG